MFRENYTIFKEHSDFIELWMLGGKEGAQSTNVVMAVFLTENILLQLYSEKGI